MLYRRYRQGIAKSYKRRDERFVERHGQPDAEARERFERRCASERRASINRARKKHGLPCVAPGRRTPIGKRAPRRAVARADEDASECSELTPDAGSTEPAPTLEKCD